MQSNSIYIDCIVSSLWLNWRDNLLIKLLTKILSCESSVQVLYCAQGIRFEHVPLSKIIPTFTCYAWAENYIWNSYIYRSEAKAPWPMLLPGPSTPCEPSLTQIHPLVWTLITDKHTLRKLHINIDETAYETRINEAIFEKKFGRNTQVYKSR